MSSNNRHFIQSNFDNSTEKHTEYEEPDKDQGNSRGRVEMNNIYTNEIPPLIKIEFDSQDSSEGDSSSQHSSEGDSSNRNESSGYQADTGSHDETSSETEETNEEKQKKEEEKEVIVSDSIPSDCGTEKKERIARKRKILMEAKQRLKEVRVLLDQKLGQKISEDESKRHSEEMQKKIMENSNDRQKDEKDTTPKSRPPSREEEPSWLRELMEDDEPILPLNQNNHQNGEFQANHCSRRRRVRSYSFTESQCELGEVHIVTMRKYYGDDMDKYLDTIGFVKRSVPRDGNSLYRTICEELFLCQRAEDIEMVKRWISWAVEVDYKIQRIRNGHVEKKGNEDELRAAASIFRAAISVYKEPNKMPVVYNPPDGRKPEIEIWLCESEPNHFERIMERATAERLGIAQAAIYQLLCAELYNLTKATVRHCIKRVRMEMGITSWNPSRTYPPSLLSPLYPPESEDHCHPNHLKFHPPLQYSKIKYMDPGIYRNIPCDLYAKEHPPTEEVKTTTPNFPLGSTVLTKVRGIVQQAEVVADYDGQNKVVRFTDGGIALARIADMRNGVAKPSPLSSLPQQNGFSHLPFLSPPVSRLPSPVNYILEPLTWSKPSPSPLMSPMKGVSPPGMRPPGFMESWPNQPQVVPGSTPGQPIVTSTPYPTSTVPAQNHPTMSTIPPPNSQRRFSVPEQIMANYNKFPMDLSLHASGYSQPPAYPVHSLTSQPINNGGNGASAPIQQQFSPISVGSSIGDESVFFPSSPKVPVTNVPYFNYEEMKQVRHDSRFSMRIDGSDLPPDTLTLRYYYNLGVDCARRMNGQMNDGEVSHSSNSSAAPPPPHMVPSPPGNFVAPMMPPIIYGMQPIPYGVPLDGAPPNVMYAGPSPPVGPTYVNGTTYYPPQEPMKDPEE